MLVITHQEGEILQIGSDIRILIRRVKGGWVRLCIDAPREVLVQRIVPSEVEEAKGAVEASATRSVTPQEIVVRRRRPRDPA